MVGKKNSHHAGEDVDKIQDPTNASSQEEAGQIRSDQEKENEVPISDESGEVNDAELTVEELLAKALEEKEACQDKMLRMAAEMENYKKRMHRERDNLLKYAGEALIRDLLPTIDNLERALAHEPGGDVSSFMEGVDMTLKGLLSTLEKAGLIPISSVGEPFNPNLHEAMVMEASKEVPDQCIIREFEKGYNYKDRLLRAAKVVVSKGDG